MANMAYLWAFRAPFGGAIYLQARHFKLKSGARKSKKTVAISSMVVIFSLTRSCKPPLLKDFLDRILLVCQCVCQVLVFDTARSPG